jgi:c-di-GMP-binding flagellar brake protein YcgR
MNDERRTDERLEILGETPGDVAIIQPMRVIEISAGGAQFEIEAPLQLESLHDCRLTLGTQVIVVKGRVAHCRIVDINPDHVVYRAGIEFIDIPPHAYDLIARFMNAIKAARAPFQSSPEA